MPAVAARIVRVLRESPLPVRTPDLTAVVAHDANNPRGRVWAELERLRRAGVVRCVRRSPAGSWWVLTSNQGG